MRSFEIKELSEAIAYPIAAFPTNKQICRSFLSHLADGLAESYVEGPDALIATLATAKLQRINCLPHLFMFVDTCAKVLEIELSKSTIDERLCISIKAVPNWLQRALARGQICSSYFFPMLVLLYTKRNLLGLLHSGFKQTAQIWDQGIRLWWRTFCSMSINLCHTASTFSTPSNISSQFTPIGYWTTRNLVFKITRWLRLLRYGT